MIHLFADAIKSGRFVVTGWCTPPRGTNVDDVRACANALKDVTSAIHVPECEDGVRMSALAACSHLIAAGAEPILHLVTRDVNRIALQAALLGAASFGVKSVLCTTGRHQALTDSKSARGVFDVDQIQLLAIADRMRQSGELVSGAKIDGGFDMLLGTDTNPFSEPMELAVMTLEKAIAAGADFVVTQPIFDLDRFEAWMQLVRERGLHERVCIIASVMPLASAEQAVDLAGKYSHLRIGEDFIARLSSFSGTQLASDIAKTLKSTDGLRGVCVMGDDCPAAREVILSSGIAGG